ncbi:hypothetical protein GCM10011583_73940 [Streptomyces camponoticapitis]|uniref:Uncharacterized protein n=1 Tax=Streptomyces camponoticapitis TaxID=1616125 RepID=A0ABQ2EYL9_9ACTN|nr:hypothetical protein [Streptomyces camponoticapitis]GGK31284.1 hypothetical protein GCM10011583_73940 [Streptomyces camponoticapitis]
MRHVERYRMVRLETVGPKTARKSVQDVLLLLRDVPGQDRLERTLHEFMGQRGHGIDAQETSPPGYSDREFAAIMAAARSDVVAIRDRISAGERLLALSREDPELLETTERERARRLETMARTGRAQVDYSGLLVGEYPAAGYAQAGQLFVVDRDLAPLMVYAAGLSGRNPETIKELPAEHRVLEEKAVVVTLTKRRRGKANSCTTVHWSVAPDPARRLRATGSFYLLLHRMMERSRAFSGTSSLWSIWAGNGRGAAANASTAGHIGPFDAELARKLGLGSWAAGHHLVDDEGGPLQMRLTRMKKTVEVRTAKQTGGHLPSLRLTKTAQTSFAHYLRGDPFVAEWAAEVLTEAITEAEESARDIVLWPAGAVAPVDDQVRRRAETGDLVTLASSCLDIDHHPEHGGRCRESSLTCLRCPNALVLERHLPMLLALAEALRADLDKRDAAQWAARHGVIWQIITHGILPRFSPGATLR